MLKKIIITQALIDAAIPVRVGSRSSYGKFEHYARNCPVALALNEALGEEFTVKYRNYLKCVFEATSIRSGPGTIKHRVFVLPGDVCQKIRLFDEDGVMEPFEFEVEVPDDV